MAGRETKSLRKENSSLRNKVDNLKTYVEQLERELSEERESTRHLQLSILSSEEAKTVEFVSAQCDDMISLHDKTINELKTIYDRLDTISKRCEGIKNYIDNAEDHSYQFNVKIIGMPMLSTEESAEETTSLCLKLFKCDGAKDISALDIDIAHRVPSRKPSNRPNPVVCRFVRRLARNKVLACRKSSKNVTASQIGFDPSICTEDLAIFEHLSPQ